MAGTGPSLRRPLVASVTRISLSASAGAALHAQRREFNMADTTQLFTSPGGLMALLYGRTGTTAAPAGDADKDKERGRRRLGGRPTRKSENLSATEDGESSGAPSGATSPPPPPPVGGGGRLNALSRSIFGSEVFWLAAVIFGLTGLWELCKTQQPVVRQKVRNFFVTTLEVRSSQTEYAMVIEWMSRQPEALQSRNLALKPVTVVDEKSSRHKNEASSEEPESALVPGYGIHQYSLNGTRVWITREQDASKKSSFAQQLDRENDVLTITFVSRNRHVAEQFLRSIREVWRKRSLRTVRILQPDYGQWRLLSERTPRPLDTLYLPPSTLEVVDEIRSFFDLRDTYTRLGIPWRRGYLFEGAPGTGKSSFVVALAGELGIPVCIISMQASGLNDQRLLHDIAKLPPRCILLMEDFENAVQGMCVTPIGHRASATPPPARGQDTGSVTLSGLLNAIDGVASSEGRVLIMTSNDSSQIPLPDALIRPGRIDRRVPFDHMDALQAAAMRRNFGKVLRESTDPRLATAAEAADATADGASSSPAKYQQLLLSSILQKHVANGPKMSPNS